MDVNEAGALDDFSAKNSAVYSTSFDRIASKSLSAVTTAGLDGIDPTITCSGFSVSDLPSDAVLEKPELTVSFIGRAEGTTAGSFAVEATTDGTNWKTYAIIPAHTEKPGRQTFTLATDISRASYTQLQVRLRPDIDIDSPTINAFLDGIALRVTSVTTAPLSPQKNKQAKNALDKLVDFSQNTYASTEEPVVTVPKKETRKFLGFTIKKVAWTLDRVEVLDTHDKTTATKYHVADQAKGDEVESVLKMDMASLHPGKYIVHVTMHNDEGGEAMIEREILWGVVALNFERASPQPKDEVRVGMGILDDLGRTICNADVTVKVRDPRGRTTTYDWTKQTITRNPNCVDKGVTNEPDYHFTFTPNLKGTYHVTLKAKTTFGERSYEDNLFVADNQRFDVQRVEYPTRINPYAGYPVRIAITPRREYSGLVYERVPEDFKISALQPNATIEKDPAHPGMKRIAWEVDWKRDSTYYLGYKFVAPQISPALFFTNRLWISWIH
jgi:hypothetical protein